MWIRRQEWVDTLARIKWLEDQVRDLQDTPRICAHNGKVLPWAGGKSRLVDAVNQIAAHVGLRWEWQPEVAAKMECLPVGKPAEHLK